MADLVDRGRLDGLQERVEKLERALAVVVAATGVTLPDDLVLGATRDPVADEVGELLRSGKRVQAVKVACDKLGLTMVEATNYVGRVEATL